MASMNRSYDPPVLTPPEDPPRTIVQVDNRSEVSDWGYLPSMTPKLQGGVPLQPSIVGKSNTADSGGGRR